MKINHCIIPLIVYLITTGVIYLISQARIQGIREMVNEAGAHGEPIIAVDTHSPGNENFSYFTINLCMLNGNSTPLGIRFDDDISEFLAFGRDGKLKFSSLFSYSRFKIELPEYRSYSIRETNQEEPPGQLIATSGNSEFELWLYEEDLILTDHLTNQVIKTFPPGEHYPWAEEGINVSHFYGSTMNRITLDTKTLFILFETSEDPNGPIQNRKQIIYRYDIAEDQSTMLTEIHGPTMITTGYTGDVIAVTTTFAFSMPDTIKFLDGRTGNPIKIIPSGLEPSIYDRWIICAEQTQYQLFTLYAYDIDDNWKQYAIKTVKGNIFYSIYEPPPNGLDGMNENYIGE